MIVAEQPGGFVAGVGTGGIVMGVGRVVTVFPDSNKKYLSTDLCRTEPMRPEYLSPSVELLGCEVVPGC